MIVSGWGLGSDHPASRFLKNSSPAPLLSPPTSLLNSIVNACYFSWPCLKIYEQRKYTKNYEISLQEYFNIGSCCYWLVGCGHCKAMKPEYTDAAKTMKDEEVSAVFDVDVSVVLFWCFFWFAAQKCCAVLYTFDSYYVCTCLYITFYYSRMLHQLQQLSTFSTNVTCNVTCCIYSRYQECWLQWMQQRQLK